MILVLADIYRPPAFKNGWLAFRSSPFLFWIGCPTDSVRDRFGSRHSPCQLSSDAQVASLVRERSSLGNSFQGLRQGSIDDHMVGAALAQLRLPSSALP